MYSKELPISFKSPRVSRREFLKFGLAVAASGLVAAASKVDIFQATASFAEGQLTKRKKEEGIATVSTSSEGMVIPQEAESQLKAEESSATSELMVQKELLSQLSMSLSQRHPNPSLNEIWGRNILLAVVRASGERDTGNINFETLASEPFTKSLIINPQQEFNFIAETGPTLTRKEGYLYDGILEGDGVCHLATQIHQVLSEAKVTNFGITIAPITAHSQSIPQFKKEHWVSILSSDPKQNLRVYNNGQQPVELQFSYNPKENQLLLSVYQLTTSYETAKEIRTGKDLIDYFGLRDKIVYLLYGRPVKYEGQKSWGSLSKTRTAEESWNLYEERKNFIQKTLQEGAVEESIGLGVLNPVYYSGPNEDPLEDIYVAKALEEAPKHQGLVALSFNNLNQASRAIDRLRKILPKERLAYLSVSLDVEWFGKGRDAYIHADDLNQFSRWFADLHKSWTGEKKIPGFVFFYTLSPHVGIGSIRELNKVNQYYLNEGIFVVPIADGFGSSEAKLNRLSELINGFDDFPSLYNTPDFPALAGTMEFVTFWGQTYDKASLIEIYNNLVGAPIKFLASQ